MHMKINIFFDHFTIWQRAAKRPHQTHAETPNDSQNARRGCKTCVFASEIMSIKLKLQKRKRLSRIGHMFILYSLTEICCSSLGLAHQYCLAHKRHTNCWMLITSWLPTQQQCAATRPLRNLPITLSDVPSPESTHLRISRVSRSSEASGLINLPGW